MPASAGRPFRRAARCFLRWGRNWGVRPIPAGWPVIIAARQVSRRKRRQLAASQYRDKVPSTPIFSLHEYVDGRGQGTITSWRDGLQRRAQARFNDKAKLLREEGPTVSTELLAGPIKDATRKYRHLYKLRIQVGGVQLRPILCKGPIDKTTEFTFLMGAFEVGGKWNPRNSCAKANKRRVAIIDDADWRQRFDP